MKKYLLILFVLVTSISACKKADDFDPVAQAATDDAAIQAYLKTNNITAVHDPSGLYYQVVTPGTGAYPNSASTVTVNYTGKLLNGTVFETNSGYVTALNAVVAGWRLGIPHVNSGGHINLFIPSGMGYGNNVSGVIPASSVLIFSIDLLSFQ